MFVHDPLSNLYIYAVLTLVFVCIENHNNTSVFFLTCNDLKETERLNKTDSVSIKKQYL